MDAQTRGQQVDGPALNHEEAGELAIMKRDESNIARCYLDAHERMEYAEHRVKFLESQINSPHSHDFMNDVRLEAAHQVDRWGTAHDVGKAAEDWFWLVGYLTGKCLASVKAGDTAKALHHTISVAAVMKNWNAHLKCVERSFQPGHAATARMVDGVKEG